MTGQEINVNMNQVRLTGLIDAPVTFSHEMYGEPFFRSIIKVPRESGTCDRIPFLVSGRICSIPALGEGMSAVITGQLRSYNCTESGRHVLRHHVFAELVSSGATGADESGVNEVKMDGYICTPPVYRVTHSGRKITSFLFAVNRQFCKSDYISCICWGRNALYVRGLDMGTHLAVTGRLQERIYRKYMPQEPVLERHVWEVSVSRVRCVEADGISA